MSDKIKFTILILLQIPASFLSIAILIYFASHRNARTKARNQIWLILLLLYLLQLITNLPSVMSYYYRGQVWPASSIYCTWWIWYEFSLNSIGLYLIAWASIERHFFIFHSFTIMRIQWKRWALHFLPISFCFVWNIIFHFVFIVVSPLCTNTWNFNQMKCGYPCFLFVKEQRYAIIEFNVHITLPLAVMILTNIMLILRVIWEKISHNQRIDWRRHRKMTFQLTLFSLLYLIFWVPFASVQLIRIFISPLFLLNYIDTLSFLTHLTPIFYPIISLNVFPEVLIEFRQFIERQMRINRIGVLPVHP